MVVGEDEAFGRYDLARAAAAEDDDGILERLAVGVVDLIDVDLQAGGLHIGGVHFLKEGQQPHAFVGEGREAHRQRA